MCPPLGKALLNETGQMVCHCLLIETHDGLVLVDTGFGVAEHLDPEGLLGRRFTTLARIKREPERAAVRQVERLGFKPSDVRHIVVTHLDLDHAGGLADFPGAQVHVYEPELEAAEARSTFNERNRYKPYQLKDANLIRHPADGQGDRWFGFEAVRPLPGLEIALVPVVGHTRGHCAVAVKSRSGWLLHCGDAYFYHAEVDPAGPRCTVGLGVYQRIIAIDNAARVANQARLVALARDHSPEITLFCAHDPKDFDRLTSGSAPRLFA